MKKKKQLKWTFWPAQQKLKSYVAQVIFHQETGTLHEWWIV